MARLRKPSPLEAFISMQQPSDTRPRRSSPRKAVRDVSYMISSSEDEENVPLRPKHSKRDLGEQSSIFPEDSFYTLKSYASSSKIALTPRRQRILRPVESNSRLLRKLSDESLRSPEKRPGSERRARRERCATEDVEVDAGRQRSLMYAKSLARSFAGRELKKASSRIDVLGDAELRIPGRPRTQKQALTVEVQEAHAEPEETSILCGEEEDVAQEAEQHQVEPSDEVTASEEQEDEEEDDVVLLVRSRQRRPQRLVEFDSESDYADAATEEEQKQEKDEPEEPQPLVSMRPPHRKGHSTISNWAQEVIDLTDSPPKALEPFVLPESTRARSSSFAVSRPATSSSDGVHPFLTYSPTPTKKRSPCKAPPVARPSTPPPAPPSPTKLVSPSKKKPLIPKAPNLRPSLDAFWNPEVVNDWNDRHSPAKKLVSPKKQQWRENITKVMGGMDIEEGSSSDEAYASPVTSPKKKAPRPQTTKNHSSVSEPTVKGVRAQRKDFADRKHALAEAFLAELDTTICSGKISNLSASTGGIQLIWSKTLKTTAGRANWRREVIRIKTSSPGSPPAFRTETRHHCSIELAAKVIDDEERLYNVLAHEFCHLLTFMISEVRNNPHGAEFKTWGRKVSLAFADRGVEVTTKHSYAIEYKFVWECVSCGYEFKRHSRSIDTQRHSCGKCKGRLVQTKPAPRAGNAADGAERKKSDYQIFVKENFKKVKSDMAARGLDTQMGKVMEVVAREYRERKEVERKEVERKEGEKGVGELDQALEGLKL
ncbi:uncharacterized protein M421DRAFT_420147 [Didymella exigua CBS 183.55]|uniref:SprT-like domain-containing protein n=1 Tax=Didymella exigua CBS 183.55 TaxID=1150837 RepID=A0A6A5RRJ8_9PLEO|nr:uncharacterized protein M421DRAFT_420147 [Didymella exigua CBS 183.55]KAF1928916.1 hypothetical protein M421DRAFT_420147 [Didymella exigua CBS 183.55]